MEKPKNRLTLEQAVADESLRQQFLTHEFTDKIRTPAIIYDPNGEQSKEYLAGGLIRTGFDSGKVQAEVNKEYDINKDQFTAGFMLIPLYFSSGIRFALFIGRNAFSRGYTLDELKCVIFGHEERHIDQMDRGFSYLCPEENKTLRDAWSTGVIPTELGKVMCEADANFQTHCLVQSRDYSVGFEFRTQLGQRLSNQRKYLTDATADKKLPVKAKYFAKKVLRFTTPVLLQYRK
jgi:hypothetical protein